MTVYNFELLDNGVEKARLAPFKAVREDIVSHYQARILEATAQQVPERELVGQRRYWRVATGWGEL